MLFSALILKLKFIKPHQIMSNSSSFSEIKSIFQCSVQAVQPKQLVNNSLKKKNNALEIQKKTYFLNKDVYVVGFGKAVFGMALALCKILQNHLVTGIISVPFGLKSSEILQNEEKFFSKIQVFEGAQNNIPDKDSELAARKICELITSLDKTDILFVLISGGGSALLPYPKPPLTLDEKQKVIKILASKGATIEELNIVRKRLSVLKGGGLVELAKPDQIISLILSDIIGDPLGLIASGPTVENSDDPTLPLTIVQKYKITNNLPQNAMKLLTEIHKPEEKEIKYVDNYIIGNNTIALQAAANKAKELLYRPIILTNKLHGTASIVGYKIIQLINAVLQQDYNTVMQICEELNIEKEMANTLFLESEVIDSEFKGICVLFGGETTVEVKGKGIGGRNQELAVSASLELHKKKTKKEIILLSAGTDGIDGPTDAAGAIATSSVMNTCIAEKLDALSYLQNNDSYNFYKSLSQGKYHVKIGHTGTNVMDVIIVLIVKS